MIIPKYEYVPIISISQISIKLKTLKLNIICLMFEYLYLIINNA